VPGVPGLAIGFCPCAGSVGFCPGTGFFYNFSPMNFIGTTNGDTPPFKSRL